MCSEWMRLVEDGRPLEIAGAFWWGYSPFTNSHFFLQRLFYRLAMAPYGSHLRSYSRYSNIFENHHWWHLTWKWRIWNSQEFVWKDSGGCEESMTAIIKLECEFPLGWPENWKSAFSMETSSTCYKLLDVITCFYMLLYYLFLFV